MPGEAADSAEGTPVLRTLADKVNWLIDRAHPAGRGPYTNNEVADLIKKTTGEEISYTQIWKLRNGQAQNPQMRLIEAMPRLLKPKGWFFLSWTNWLSPWGGHSFSPFHYLGPRAGFWVYTNLWRGRRKDIPFVNLYPTYIGRILKVLRSQPDLRLVNVAPRYYPELSFLVRVPIAREFLCWNCATLMQKRS